VKQQYLDLAWYWTICGGGCFGKCGDKSATLNHSMLELELRWVGFHSFTAFVDFPFREHVSFDKVIHQQEEKHQRMSQPVKEQNGMKKTPQNTNSPK